MEKNDFQKIVDEAVAKVKAFVEEENAKGHDYVTANDIMRIYIEVLKPEIEPNDYIRDEQVVLPIGWILNDE